MTHQEAIELINLQLSALNAENEDDNEVVNSLREILAEGKNLTIRIRSEFIFAIMDMKDERHSNKTWLFALDSLPLIKQSFVNGGAMDVLFKHQVEGLVRELVFLKKKLGTSLNIIPLVTEQLINQGESHG